MSTVRVALLAGLVSAVWLGCGQQGAGQAVPLASATGGPETRSRGRVKGEGVARSELPMLGPDEVRVELFVVPGDARVEVDGSPARRRNGVIELVGKVGYTRRVRVFKGAKVTEKIVKIKAKGAEPSLIDANEEKAAEPRVAKPKPAQFNVDE